MREFFLYGLNSGLLPKAPGTWGSIVGAIIGYLFLLVLPTSTLFLFASLVTIIAVKHIDIYEEETLIHDDKRIVIDEFVGMWIAMSLTKGNIIEILLAFVYFRILDIKKPSIIGKVDSKLEGGWGVMLDDILAGIFAGILASGTYMIIGMF